MSIEDCIAMSEDGDWYAYPYSMTRGQVIQSLADDSSWWDVLHEFTIHAGHVLEVNEGWWQQCNDRVPGAVQAWLVRR